MEFRLQLKPELRAGPRASAGVAAAEVFAATCGEDAEEFGGFMAANGRRSSSASQCLMRRAKRITSVSRFKVALCSQNSHLAARSH